MSDLKRYGAGEDLGFYWVSREHQFGGPTLHLIAVDAVGNVMSTPRKKEVDDPAAPNQNEAVIEHLASATKEADANLERRRRELSEKPPEPEPPARDRATEKFFEEWD